MSRASARHLLFKFVGLSLLITVAACTSSTDPQPSDIESQDGRVEAELFLEEPEEGFQIEILGNMIDAGDDIKWCETVQLPGTPEDIYHIIGIESAMTRFGHSLEVSSAIPDSETEENMEIGARVICQRAGEVFGEELEDVFSTQHLYGNVRYPDGIGKILFGGQKIVVSHHYYNVLEEAVPAKVKLNFHLGDENDIKKVSRTATFENFTIYTPPSGDSSHLAECFVDQDILVSSLERRTHQWGTDFKVWYAGGERDGEHIWTSSDWEKDAYYRIPKGPILLKASEGFRFECNYRNNTNNPIQFGVYAIDEICMLKVNWWTVVEGDAVSEQRCLLFSTDEDGISRK